MSTRSISIILALTAILSIAAFAFASPTREAEAHADPLSDLASTAGAVADAISAGGAGPSTAQIMALGTAANAVVDDAPNHAACTTMASLGDSAVDVYEWLHAEYLASGGAATAATYSDHLTALEAIASEAEDLAAQKQTSTPTPTPTPTDTPTSTPTPTPPATATPTPPATATPAPPAAADTGSGGISSTEAGLGLLAFTAVLASMIVLGGRVATRRTRS